MTKSRYRLYSDGGSRGNPGPAAIGVVIYDGEKKIAKISRAIGITTNNQAEYQAIIAGMKKAMELKIDVLECFLDSSLVVHQLSGDWKVKEKSLQKVFIKAWNLKQGFTKISYRYIPRSQNKEADSLVNKALDKIY